jgi:hypothetical protein
MKPCWIILPIVLLLVFTAGCGLSEGAGGYGAAGPVIVPYKDTNFTVGPLSKYELTVNASQGAVIEGYLTVRGGNDDVRFYIEDSYGKKVLDKNRVNDRYDFSYAVESSGFHTLYFDNSFSLITSKEVFLHYRVR